MPLLKVQNIEVCYGAIRALRDVSLEVEAGEIVTLIGANGAGKTSLLRTISGLLKPSSGRIFFGEREITRTPPDQIVRMGVSHSPEGRQVFAPLTVRENLELGAYCRRDRTEVKQDLERVFALFPRLRERLDQLAGTLSGGEQQMLAIGRALMSRPRLLLLDEPSLGLAPFLVREIFRIVQEINQQGTTILLVEQNAYQALHIAHRGYVLQSGEVVLQGPAQVLLSSELIRRAYLG